MKNIKKIFLLFVTLLFCFVAKSQNQEYFDFSKRGEVFFSFSKTEANNQLSKLNNIISIDKIEDDVVYAYANEQEFLSFLEFNVEPTVLTAPSMIEKGYKMYSLDQYLSKETYEWDSYPTYEAYVQMMNDFATNNPTLCGVEEIGTTIHNRKLLLCKITSNLNPNSKTRILLTSSMHGDETTGYVLMLRLIDYLLTNYNTDNRIKNILDNAEIWICPLANPDGTYAGGNSSVWGSTRYNGNNKDLNRNYKDDYYGDHPDGNAWQPETIAFMNLETDYVFTIGFNVHGGAEVCNYVWDNKSVLFADNQWWKEVLREYADTCHVYNSNYMTYLNNGITNGYDWYSISGSRQDNAQAFHQIREFTLEISDTKTLNASQLPAHWNWNYRSFLNFIERGLYGIHGNITDIATGEAIPGCKVYIQSHDDNFSYVFSNETGYYARPIKAGTYTITYKAPGYEQAQKTVTLNNDKSKVIQDVQLGFLGIEVDFSADNTSITPNTQVQFTDMSFPENMIVSRNWTFEGGIPSTSTSQNPKITYSSEGVYDVTLTVSDGITEKNLTKQNYISVTEQYLMSDGTITTCSGIFLDSGGEYGNYSNYENYTLTFLPETPNAKIKVEFISFQTENNYDKLKIYNGASTSSPLIGTYSGSNSPGTIISTSSNGALTFSFSSDYWTNYSGWKAIISCEGGGEIIESPVANFTANATTIDEGSSVNFTDLSTNEPTSWSWIFEGGTPSTSTSQNPTVVYNTAGTYDVTLTVSNAGGTDTKKITNYITVNSVVETPVANFTANATTIDEGGSVNFTDLSTNEPTSWNWIFEGGIPSTSTLQNPTVVYNTAGTYDVTLTVSNAGGNDTKKITNYITVNSVVDSPVANFTADVTTIEEGGSVSFTDLSTNEPTSWNWIFEGGTPSTSTSQNPTVVYNTAGTYDVTLIVSNAGGTDTKKITNYITVNSVVDSPVANFAADVTAFDAGDSVNFTDLSTNEPTSWNWTFEGGIPSSSTAQNPTVVYNTAGTYDVTLTVSNAGGTDTKKKTNYITVNPVVDSPVANFTANATTIDEGGSVDFTDLSTNEPTSWNWIFEGGTPSTSTEQNPTVVYNTAGTYDVTLTVSNAGGNDTKKITNYITVNSVVDSPVANFTADVTTIDEGGSVNFTDLSTNEPTSWNWVFEGGTPSTSTSQNPTVVYNTAGTYDVTLTVSNEAGTDTKEISNYITVNAIGEAPIADFDVDNTNIEVNEEVHFTDLSLNEPTSWNWTFEGGTPSTSTSQNPTVTYKSEGDFSVSLTVNNEFGSDTYTAENLIHVIAGIGIEDKEEEIYLHPNPANNFVVIKAENIITKVELFDMLGKKILSENFNSKSVTLNVSNISQGFYIIKTTTKTQKFENKITIIN
ncbi:MAG: PKD domain-containing protein [Bacteroidales bacterium]|jgi:PKD repeat protein